MSFVPPKNAIAMAPAYGLPPPSPTEAERTAWAEPLLRATALMAALAALMGMLVVPGLQGNAREATVIWGERISAVLAYVTTAGLVTLLSFAGYELMYRTRLGTGTRLAAIGFSGLGVALVAPALFQPLHALAQVALSMATSLFAVMAAVVSLRTPHTRAPGGVLALFGVSSFCRAAAWLIAAIATSRASLGGYDVARGFQSAAVVFEGLGQAVAVAYFATRGRVQGRILGNLAIALGLVVTYIAARRPQGAGVLGSVLHSALAQGASVPEPVGLGPIAVFLFPTALFLAIVAAVQRGQVAAIAAGLTFVLASNARFDVPLPALLATTGGLWLLIAVADERALWTDLIGARRQRVADEKER